MSALAYRHQRVQRLRRLLGRRSARQEEGCFVVEGLNLLEEALATGSLVEAVYVATSGQEPAPGPPASLGAGDRGLGDGELEEGPLGQRRQERLRAALEASYQSGARIFDIEPAALARVAGTVSPQPVMAIVRVPQVSMDELERRAPGLVVMCVDVRDPGNAGTVARSAWAAGADAVLCCDGTVDIWNPKAVRSSAGAVLRVPVVAAGAPEAALERLRAWGLWRLGAVSAGGDDYVETDMARRLAFVVGNEAAGLPLGGLRNQLDGLVSIPMPGGAESLNVGMATTVLCFEAARQRRARLPDGACRTATRTVDRALEGLPGPGPAAKRPPEP